jgi:hypothetical protein
VASGLGERFSPLTRIATVEVADFLVALGGMDYRATGRIRERVQQLEESIARSALDPFTGREGLGDRAR